MILITIVFIGYINQLITGGPHMVCGVCFLKAILKFYSFVITFLYLGGQKFSCFHIFCPSFSQSPLYFLICSMVFSSLVSICSICFRCFLVPMSMAESLWRQDPSGRCVSDGPIEFSSPVYHVYKERVSGHEKWSCICVFFFFRSKHGDFRWFYGI